MAHPKANAQDRSAIKQMSGLGQNATGWSENPPTIIPVPSNNRPPMRMKATSSSNPYSTIGRNGQSGVVANMKPKQRAREDISDRPNKRLRPNPKPAQGSSRGVIKPLPQRRTAIHISSSEDVSSSPMKLSHREPSVSDDDRTFDPERRVPRPAFALAPDGEHTSEIERQVKSSERMKKVYHVDDDDDEITAFTPSPPSPRPQKGLVKERVKQIENNNSAVMTNGKQKAHSRRVQGEQREKPSRGNGNPYFGQNPAMKTIGRKLLNGQRSQMLPITAFQTGDRTVGKDDADFHLYWGRSILQIRDEEGNVHLDIDTDHMKRRFESTQMRMQGNPVPDVVIIRLDDEIIRFDTGERFNLKGYEDLRHHLRAIVRPKETFLTPSGAQTIWEHAERNDVDSSLIRHNSPIDVDDNDDEGDNLEEPVACKQPSKYFTKLGDIGQSSGMHSHGKAKAIPMTARIRSTASGGNGRAHTSSLGRDITLPIRRSTRAAVVPEPKVDPDEVILVYPYGVPGAVNLTNGDIARLKPGEYLNDTLIEFGLKRWLNGLQESNPSLAEQVHVFSSFFYKKLNKKPLEEGYNSVRKWTSKFDLFKKKFVIVPINENMHWYLALICEPEHVLRIPENSEPALQQPLESVCLSSSEQTSDSGAPPNRLGSLQEATQSSDVEVEANLTNLTQACSIQSPEAKAQTPSPMDVDSPVARQQARSPSPALSYVSVEIESSESKLPKSTSVSEPTRLSPSPPDHAESPEIAVLDLSAYSSRKPSSEADTITNVAATTAPILVEDEEDADVLNITEESIQMEPGPTEIPPESFYGKSSAAASNAKARRKQPKSKVKSKKPAAPPKPKGPLPNTTYVLTLDSLGTKHSHAAAVLAKYLHLEAKDKKGIESTARVERETASVPTQPNYCDCGLYLLHLAQTFVADPKLYLEKSCSREKVTNAQRQIDWHDHKVPEMRQWMLDDIRKLSVEWKELKAKAKAREEAESGAEPGAKKEGGAMSDSDDEIIVGDVVSKRTNKKKEPLPATNITTRQSAQRIR